MRRSDTVSCLAQTRAPAPPRLRFAPPSQLAPARPISGVQVPTCVIPPRRPILALLSVATIFAAVLKLHPAVRPTAVAPAPKPAATAFADLEKRPPRARRIAVAAPVQARLRCAPRNRLAPAPATTGAPITASATPASHPALAPAPTLAVTAFAHRAKRPSLARLTAVAPHAQDRPRPVCRNRLAPASATTGAPITACAIPARDPARVLQRVRYAATAPVTAAKRLLLVRLIAGAAAPPPATAMAFAMALKARPPVPLIVAAAAAPPAAPLCRGCATVARSVHRLGTSGARVRVCVIPPKPAVPVLQQGLLPAAAARAGAKLIRCIAWPKEWEILPAP